MADQARGSIVIAADPPAVMAVIADFEHYPEWAGFIKRCEVVEAGATGRADKVRFALDAGVLKDTYVLAYDWDGDHRVDWHLVEGKALKAQDGSYVLTGSDGSTTVEYALSVALSIPMLGMFKRKAEKVIIDTALNELKKRVEA